MMILIYTDSGGGDDGNAGDDTHTYTHMHMPYTRDIPQ